MKVFVIDYNGTVNRKGYKTKKEVIEELTKQGYKHYFGSIYEDLKGNFAKIYEIKIK